MNKADLITAISGQTGLTRKDSEAAVMEEDNVLPMCCPGNDVDDMLLEI